MGSTLEVSLCSHGTWRDKYGCPKCDAHERAVCFIVFEALHESLCAGGHSASRIVERLNELGLRRVCVSDLHGAGLQDVANALHDARSEQT